jgi:hypothetical protein
VNMNGKTREGSIQSIPYPPNSQSALTEINQKED